MKQAAIQIANLMPRFNIAAVPVDPLFHKDFYRAAAGIDALKDGYYLAEGKALPHVTLCQFRAADAHQALHIMREFIGKEFDLKNSGIFILQDAPEDKNHNRFWIMYVVRRLPELIATQAAIVDLLTGASLEIFTQKSENYFPHFTLARTAGLPVGLNQNSIFTQRLTQDEIKCRLRLGLSDENGQFLKTLDGPL